MTRLLVFLSLLSFTCAAQIRVTSNQRFLETTDGKPFFWLGDTDWELFHRLNREETETFLEIRKQQGFNVIQAVALAEFNGLHQPNRYGDLPLINDDPTRLAITTGNNSSSQNEYDYWDHVDFVIDKAAEKNLYMGLLPTWGDKVAHLWGDGPIVFNEKNAYTYARTLAKRYGKKWNVLWILGGDRPAVYKSSKEGNEKEYDDRPVWKAMAKAIEDELGKEAFITYHPGGGSNSTTQYIHNEPWLDMNSFQSGHGARETEAWDWVIRDLTMKPVKPTLDMEPCYEDHPVNPWDGKWTRQRGYFTAYDVRARIYRGVFAGACGVTYGHHQIWQFLNTTLNEPVNVGDTLIPWQKATQAEAANQMKYLKKLMLSRPYVTRIADQSIIKANRGKDYTDLVYATRDENSSYALIYLPQKQSVSIDLSKISGTTKAIGWFDPRTGKFIKDKDVQGNPILSFQPPQQNNSNSKEDWILIIDDASKKYSSPEL